MQPGRKTNGLTQNHAIVHLYKNHKKEKEKSETSEKGRGTNEYKGNGLLHNTDCCLMLQLTTAAPKPKASTS
jgi:hypothetical protein